MASPIPQELKDVLTNDFLCCSICMEEYTTPKMLPCLHNYCLKCLGQYVSETAPPLPDAIFLCPTCRQETPTPPGGPDNFPTNFFIISLLDVMRSQRDSAKPCDMCKRRSIENSATHMCIDCVDSLCSPCAEIHCTTKLTTNHKVVTLSDIVAGKCNDEMMTKKQTMCQKHDQKELEIFCSTCEAPVCMKCAILEHKNHDCEEVETAALQRKQGIYDHVEKLREGTKSQQESIDEKDKQSSHLVEIQEKINSELDGRLEKLKLKHQAIKDEVADFCRTEEKVIQAEKNNYQCKLAALESSIDFAEKILSHGKDVELLQLQVHLVNRFETLTTENKEKDKQELNDIILADHETYIQSDKPSFHPIRKPKLIKEWDAKLVTKKDKMYLSGLAISSTGNTFVADHTNSKVICYDNDGKSQPVPTENLFKRPFAIQILPHNDDCIVTCYPSKEVLLLSKNCESLKSGLSLPQYCTGLAVLDNETVIVTSTKSVNKQGEKNIYMLKIVNDNLSLQESDHLESIKEHLQSPHYVTYTRGKICISDCGKKALLAFNTEGSLLYTYTGPDGLLDPQGVCVDKEGNIILADNHKHNIHLVSPEGKFICYLVTKQDGLQQPCAVALTPDGDLAVTESSGKIKVFNYC